MRAKLVQGKNSMIWANRVLPTFTAAPRGCQSRETTYYLVVRIQIGTKSNWTQTRANACSRACHGGFNRTAVISVVSAALVLSYAVAPVSVAALRKNSPDMTRPFRVKALA